MIRLLLASALALSIAPAASSAATYQRKIALSCAAEACSGETPAVAAKRTLTVKTISCIMFASGTNPAIGIWGEAIVMNANDTVAFEQNFRLETVSGNGFVSSVFSVPTVLKSGQRLLLRGRLNGGGSMINGACSVAGTTKKS